MANPFVKFWKYLMAAFSSKIDEHADPKVQIQQAIEDAQRQHQALSQQAAAVIGNQRQLEMKLNRQLGEVEKLQASARQALVLADEARGKGDEPKAAQFENAAAAFATQLVTAEQASRTSRRCTTRRCRRPARPRRRSSATPWCCSRSWPSAPSCSASSSRPRCRSRCPLAKPMSELAAPGNVPSLEEVRDKIEKRYATAIGSAELAQNSVQGRMLEVQASTTEMAGQSRLEQIRASMRGGSVAPQVTAGNSAGSSAAGGSASSIQAEIAKRVAQEQKADPA